jgi:hypothetical protein
MGEAKKLVILAVIQRHYSSELILCAGNIGEMKERWVSKPIK